MRTLILSLLLTFPVLAQTTNELIVPQAAAPRILLPVAGNSQGANGTYFRSDISVINLRASVQRVAIYWMPQGGAGSSSPVRTIDFNAQSGLSSENFVADVLGQTGVGGIEIVGLTADGQFDPGAALHVTSRIWTPRPDGGAGTMSQTFPAVVANAQGNDIVKAAFGLRRTSQYRMNVGAMNPSSTTQRFRVTVTVSGAEGPDQQVLEFDVPARAIQQLVVPGTSSGLAQVLIENIGGGGADWQGWASSVDNQSGDAWSQLAVGG